MDGLANVPALRRGTRDWVVDTMLFLLASAYGVLTAGVRLDAASLPAPAWLFDLDQFIGALGCAALWLRRRWPVGLAVVLIGLSTFSELVAGAMLVALFSVAVHRPPRITLPLFGLSLLAALVYVVVRPEPGVSGYVMFVMGAGLEGAAIGWGLVVRHQRQLVGNAAAEARLRAEQAQLQAREAVAREMHDVLGHRLSLLSVHAGALEFRPDAPAEDIAHAAAVIRQSAHQALQDLREVIGVLRAPVGELPQPTIADVHELIAESGRTGMRVVLVKELSGIVPDQAGRTAYRIVQEALTNARKHAPGAEVRLHVAGAPGQGLTVEVCNASPAAAPAAVPVPGAQAGQGLTGLAERVALASGRLEYGPDATGGWRLAAWLPWPS